MSKRKPDPGPLHPRKDVADRMKIDVKHCARCGAKIHKQLEFHALRRPAKEFGWWASCPVTGEPVLLIIHKLVEEVEAAQ